MKILIKKGAARQHQVQVGGNGEHSNRYRKALESIEGTWVEVETDYLFQSEFNTGPIEGLSENGLKIAATYVEAVQDDARIGKMRCNYCGTTSIVTQTCPKCGKSDYIKAFVFEFGPIVPRMVPVQAETDGVKC